MAKLNGKDVLFSPTINYFPIRQHYDPTSEDAQSGKAVAEALETKEDKFKTEEMPDASEYEGFIVQYIGVTDEDYTNGYFYKSDGTDWQQLNVQPSGSSGTTDYDDLTDKPQINGITLSGNKTYAQLGLQKILQRTGNWLDSAGYEDYGIYQCTTDYQGNLAILKKGHFYEVYDSGNVTQVRELPPVDIDSKQSKAISTTITILQSDWTGSAGVYTCTKQIDSVTPENIVFCDASNPDVQCTAQGNKELTFTATSMPTSAVTVKVVVLP